MVSLVGPRCMIPASVRDIVTRKPQHVDLVHTPAKRALSACDVALGNGQTRIIVKNSVIKYCCGPSIILGLRTGGDAR